MGTVVLYVNWPFGTQLNLTMPSSGNRYTWKAATDGATLVVDKADEPELLELTYKRGKDCGCSGGVPAAQGNNEKVNYFSRTPI